VAVPGFVEGIDEGPEFALAPDERRTQSFVPRFLQHSFPDE
jgi:hypothetical protein